MNIVFQMQQLHGHNRNFFWYYSKTHIMRHNSKLNRLTSQISSPLKVSSLPLATSIITMSLCLLFSVFLVKSVHAEDIYETDYGTYASNLYSDVTDIINSDFIIRTSGSFRYLRYPVSRTTVDGDRQEKSFIVMDSINESVSMRHIKPHLYEKV